MNKALLMAMGNAGLERGEIDVVLNARRTVMDFENKYWVRKDRIAEFDITMGATDSAQVTDLVGLYLLHELELEFPELEGGVYRDDALFLVKNMSRGEIERLKKRVRAFYRTYNLQIIFESNMKVVNFLDVTLELDTGKFRPFHKLILLYLYFGMNMECLN